MAYMDNIPTVYLEQGKRFISGHPKKTKTTTTTTIMYITIPHKLRADRNCATKFNGEYNPPQMGGGQSMGGEGEIFHTSSLCDRNT